jgi:hypothetical protein
MARTLRVSALFLGAGIAGAALAADPYQQDSGSTGLVVVETEGFTGNAARNGISWKPSYPLGHSGSGGLEAAPNSGINNSSGFVDSSPRLDYRVKFTKSGTHYVWVRALGATTSDDSLHVGLDGKAFATATAMGDFAPVLGWNNRLMNGSLAMINVPSPGEHTLNLWMREDGVVIDKVVLTTSGSYQPSGNGPAVSPRTAPAVVGSAFPVDLRGAAPEQAVVSHSVSKPSGAQTATVTLSTFDADMVDEGEMVINGNTPIVMFGSKGKASNDDQNADVTFTTPASYWRNGDNSVVFRHNRTAGFSINGMSVVFDGSAPVVDSSNVSSSGEAVLIQLTGSAPEQASMVLNVNKPSSAANAILSLATFDADMRDEGELIINGNPPVMLFGSAGTLSNDGNAARIDLPTPVSYWRNGTNNLTFKHIRTGGYIIDNVAVNFSGSAGTASNSLPVISGNPPTTATVGSSYAFQPTAVDADGDKMTFSVSNLPGWASFNSSTGRLSGVPGPADSGSNGNIRISVSDGKGTSYLPTFAINVAGGSTAGTASVVLEWSPPSAREDGSPLSPSQIAGYTVYFGAAPNSFTQSVYVAGGNNTQATLNNLATGETIYIALRASDTSGLQSDYSSVLQVDVM